MGSARGHKGSMQGREERVASDCFVNNNTPLVHWGRLHQLRANRVSNKASTQTWVSLNLMESFINNLRVFIKLIRNYGDWITYLYFLFFTFPSKQKKYKMNKTMNVFALHILWEKFKIFKLTIDSFHFSQFGSNVLIW